MPTFFGLSIPTHRTLDGNDNDDGSSSFFPYEPIIAAISILFFRITVKLQRQKQLHQKSSSSSPPVVDDDEYTVLRYGFAIILGILAYTQQSYQYIITAELSSYMISYIVLYVITTVSQPQQQLPAEKNITTTYFVLFQRFVYILMGTLVSLLLSYGIVISFCDPTLQKLFLDDMIPNAIKQAFLYLFPIVEMQKAYSIMEQFMTTMDQEFFHHMIHHLFFVTFHIQVGMGYLGIAFLRSEQSRRNQLIRLDVYDDDDGETDCDDDNHHHINGVTNNGKDTTTNHNKEQKQNTKKSNKEKQMSKKSRIFQKGAAPFSTSNTLFLPLIVFVLEVDRRF